MRNAYVYIMTNRSGTLYTGVTNNLARRVIEHKVSNNATSFSAQYQCHKLLYFEQHADMPEAIERETRIKSWRREKKVTLIATMNPEWEDLWEKFEE